MLTLLNQLFDLQSKFVSTKSTSTADLGDEEITSEESGDEVTKDTKPATSTNGSTRKRKSLSEMGDGLAKRFADLRDERIRTLKVWDERTSIGAAKAKDKFANFHQPVNTQIAQVLANKERLLKRTYTRRDPQPLFYEAKAPDEETTSTEIFDDNDFYETQLRDLISRRAALSATGDSLALGRQHAELNSLRTKSAKRVTVDTRASKGRKLRYDVKSKLVNFMTPYAPPDVWSDEAMNELFSSLFGARDNPSRKLKQLT